MGDTEELMEITINYEGADFLVFTDIHTANTLLNDPETAAEYIKKNYVVTVEDSADVGHEDNVEECSKENTEEIWSSKKPTNRDNLATECFLKLRYALTEKFVDKKNNKGKLWAQVAASMEQKRFKLGSNGSERCRQKFANLQKMYFGYIRGHVKKTGTEKKEEPMFYELMHAILGDKDKTNPKCLLDSDERPEVTKQKDAVLQSCTQNYATQSASTSTSTDEDTAGPSTPQSHNIKSRFSRDRTPLKPQSNVNQIINCLKNELGKDRDDRQKQFEALNTSLDQQNQQRERFLNIFEEMVAIKRRRVESDD
ncbi:hypothetical protein RN001_002653 [Aquatica leii]|uniref:Myb/SANT-like DNA-binding domain-containing protein n=1 Tax=Aquatica leii TaxID=1421715 RepID=A0AAN7SKA3_9COLE|nr:hypothetical protein RN001_002653 [Aquatica leii]